MTKQNQILTAVTLGLLAATAMFTLYATVVTAVSGWTWAGQQFGATWYFVVSLAVGFGFQVGLYTYLRQSLADMQASGKVVAVSGTTSTAAMLACCVHYLANVAPLLGLVGAISLVAQYQQQLFWVGMLLNLAGVVYIARQIIQSNTFRYGYGH